MKYDEAIRILGNVSLDYTGMNQEEIDQMDEALTLAFNAMSIMIKNKNIPKEVEWIKAHKDFQRLAFKDLRISILEERIKELERELEESRAKEGKGALETVLESFGQLVASLNEALQGMSPEEIRELLRPDEEEDHD